MTNTSYAANGAVNAAANPFDWWMQTNLSMMKAGLDAASATATAMTSALGQAPAKHAPPRQERPAQQAKPVADSRKGRSWYKAPYRSPFDPMFWMMPGHPVDHAGDWIAPFMGAAAMGASRPSTAGASGNPFASAFAPAFTPSFAPVFPGSFTASANPWMAPLLAWSECFVPRHGAKALMDAAASNVVEFDKAYSAYRTAGGHASTQITRGKAASKAEPTCEPQSAIVNPAEFWRALFPMAPWLR